jgi:ankyrin repeat protein
MFFFKNKHKSLIENVEKGNLEEFVKSATEELLVKKFEYEDYDSFNLLLLATHLEKGEIVSYIVNNFPGLINEYDEHGRTALQIAIRLKNPELVGMLIENGANPDLIADVDNSVTRCLEQSTISTFEIMKKVIENSPLIKAKKHTSEYTSEMINEAAGDILKILHSGLVLKLPDDADLEMELIERLKYLRSIDCDFNIKMYVETIGYVHHYILPIQENQPFVLEYILENNVNPNDENYIVGYACDYAAHEEMYSLVPIIQKYGGVFTNKEMEGKYNEYQETIKNAFNYKLIFHDLTTEQKEFAYKIFLDFLWERGFNALTHDVSENGSEFTIEFSSPKYAAEIAGYNYEVFLEEHMIDDDENYDEFSFKENSNNIIPYLVCREQFFGLLWGSDKGFETKNIVFVDHHDNKFKAVLSKDSDLLVID